MNLEAGCKASNYFYPDNKAQKNPSLSDGFVQFKALANYFLSSALLMMNRRLPRCAFVSSFRETAVAS